MLCITLSAAILRTVGGERDGAQFLASRAPFAVVRNAPSSPAAATGPFQFSPPFQSIPPNRNDRRGGDVMAPVRNLGKRLGGHAILELFFGYSTCAENCNLILFGMEMAVRKRGYG